MTQRWTRAAAQYAVVAALGLSFAACGSLRARPADPGVPLAALADGTSVLVAAQSGVPASAGTTALNGRLLAQVSPPGTEGDLPMGPGDLIEISVFEVPELSQLKVRVPMRGTVTLPLIGQVPAAGRTAIQLEDDLRRRLQQRYMHDPQVSVFVHEQRSQRISVVGAVRKGGLHTMTGPMRVADALALAEGLAEDADHVVYLVRRVPAGTVARVQAGRDPVTPAAQATPGTPTEEVMVPIDLEALANGRDELNVDLQAGDVIHVPRAGSYYVGGEVRKPGSFFLKSRTTLDHAIVAAGGVTNVAAWGDVRLYRTGSSGEREVLEFDLDEIEQGEAAPALQKNDVVIVGKSGGKAFFYGFVDFFRGVFGINKPL